MKSSKPRILTNSVLLVLNPIVDLYELLIKKYFRILLFLILPIIFLVGANSVHYSYGNFYQGNVDPEYFHLYNGVVIGGGNLAVQYTAHPGTPLQFIVATAARINYLFQAGENYRQDFMDDPEKYLNASNLLLNLLVTLALFLCGWRVAKYTGSAILGFVIQVSPLGSASVMLISGRLLPETMMIIPLLIISLLMIRYIYQSASPSKLDPVLFGVVVGFGTAIKLSFLPIIIIPLTMLSISLKRKFKLLLYTIISFAVFAYPVIFNFGKFWDWISGLFSHSGLHGKGEQSFIDYSSLPYNMSIIFEQDKLFFYIAILSLILAALFSSGVLTAPNTIVRKSSRAILALNLSILVSLALTLKHFALHYFMPFFLFKIILLVLCTILILNMKNLLSLKRNRIIFLIIISILTLSFSYLQSIQLKSKLAEIEGNAEYHEAQFDNIIPKVKQDLPIIISSPYYGSPFMEFAQNQGFMMCNHRKNFFKPYLKSKYPLSFLYVRWKDEFNYWDDFVDFNFILERTNNSFYIYLGEQKSQDLIEIEKRLWKVVDEAKVSKSVLFEDPISGEILIEVMVNENS